MTINALIYGGIQIGSITPPRAHWTYDGVSMSIKGAVRTGSGYDPAYITLDMSATDAMDMAMALIVAAEKHADYESKMLPTLAKRLHRRVERKEK